MKCNFVAQHVQKIVCFFWFCFLIFQDFLAGADRSERGVIYLRRPWRAGVDARTTGHSRIRLSHSQRELAISKILDTELQLHSQRKKKKRTRSSTSWISRSLSRTMFPTRSSNVVNSLTIHSLLLVLNTVSQ